MAKKSPKSSNVSNIRSGSGRPGKNAKDTKSAPPPDAPTETQQVPGDQAGDQTGDQQIAVLVNALMGVVDGQPQQIAALAMSSAVARVLLMTNITAQQFQQLLTAQIENAARDMLAQQRRPQAPPKGKGKGKGKGRGSKAAAK